MNKFNEPIGMIFVIIALASFFIPCTLSVVSFVISGCLARYFLTH